MATENPTVVAGIDPASITAAMISADFPLVASAIRAEGAETERGRILAIQDASLPGFESVATAAIEAGHTAETFALAQAKAQKAAGPAYLAALRSDEAALPVIRPDAAPAPKAEGIDRTLPLEDQIKAEWAGSPAVRDEFLGNFATYSAFRTAEAAGRVKILRKG